jgi:UDP-glucose 4,6-dehydratase
MPAVLVTGGLGFIGAAYVNLLCARMAAGEEVDLDAVVVLDCLTYAGDAGRLSPEAAARVTLVRANLRSWSRVLRLLRENDVVEIVHFAAYSHVGASFETPGEFVEDNVGGTYTLLECARLHGARLRRFVHVSTDEVYGQSSTAGDARPFDEGDVLAPTNPYSASKACAEIFASTYWRCFGLPVLVLRPNNTFGPSQHREKLIPAFTLAVAEGRRMRIEGSGHQRRSFLFSSDVASAVDLIRRDGAAGEIYNVGGSTEHAVLQVAEAVLRVQRPGEAVADWLDFVEDRPFNDQRYYVDCAKLRSLGWTQLVGLEEGLRAVAEAERPW